MTTGNTPSKTATKTEPKDTTEKAKLAPAGQSGDPDVQRLLANREAHRLAIADIDEQLEALGVTAG